MSAQFRFASLLLLLTVAHTAAADIVVEDGFLSHAPATKTPSATPAIVKTPMATNSPAISTTSTSASSSDSSSNTAPTNAAASAAASDSADTADSSNTNSNWQLYTQMQQLQQNVDQLRGTVEEQAHQIQQLKSDLRTRYTDLDQRLVAQQAQSKPIADTAPTAASSNTATAPSATIEDEKKSYLAAYDTFRAGGPDKAIPPMMTFVMRYPNSTLTPNAYYWLGEFYLNASTPDQAAAQKNFEIVLNKYPDNAKAPAALYKIGSILDMQGKQQDAKKKMLELKAKYPKSPEAALADNYLKALEAASAPAPAATPKKPHKKTPNHTQSHDA
jgi:tol-pal system protein YbgF